MNSAAQSDIQQKLLKMIYKHFPVAETLALTLDQNLLDSGAVDSLGLLIIIDLVEKEYAVKVNDTDVVTENFGSVAGLANYIIKKQAGEC